MCTCPGESWTQRHIVAKKGLDAVQQTGNCASQVNRHSRCGPALLKFVCTHATGRACENAHGVRSSYDVANALRRVARRPRRESRHLTRARHVRRRHANPQETISTLPELLRARAGTGVIPGNVVVTGVKDLGRPHAASPLRTDTDQAIHAHCHASWGSKRIRSAGKGVHRTQLA